MNHRVAHLSVFTPQRALRSRIQRYSLVGRSFYQDNVVDRKVQQLTV